MSAGVRRAKVERRKAGLLTPRDLAYESGFALRSIYLALDSDLPSVRIGNRRYVRRETWDQWLRGKPGNAA